MLYNTFKDKKLSALGLGTMRFPVVGDDYANIDIEKTREIFDYAFSNGINYFDTAFGYHNGNSEIVCGQMLKNYPRDSFYLASKFPGFSEENVINHEEIFEKQLKKCGVEYFDFYLFHNLFSRNAGWYMDDEKYGLYTYLCKQRDAGRIKHLGVSCHCDLETLRAFLDKYGKDIEFVQIQLNWLDWTLQDAKAKVELLNERNIPIWVMEPVRGGKLASLAPADEESLKALRPDEGIPAWAFRYLQSIKGVTMVLSGMSNMQQITDNINTFSEYKPLSEQEKAALAKIAEGMLNSVPCTACRYCTEGCPAGLDIPDLIKAYNRKEFEGLGRVKKLEEDKKPSACIGCRACEAVCPQNIKIADIMSEMSELIKEKEE
ncbi:MAG: aldo/keto reductase [Clostridia bacterium]|nr:aldo/keto reductase [Clostridia bacterium]